MRRMDKHATILVRFHERFERWPTNSKEFGTFVTGSGRGGTNPLSIILELKADDSIEIASEFSEERRRVVPPAKR